MKSSLEEKDFQLLNLYLDGELSSAQNERVAERLGSEPSLQLAFEELLSMRQGIREWSIGAAAGSDGRAREVDCWTGVRQGIFLQSTRTVAKRTFSDLALDAFLKIFASPVLSPALLAVAILAGLTVNSDPRPTSLQAFASRSEHAAAILPVNGSIARTSAPIYVAPLMMPEPTFVTYRKRLNSGILNQQNLEVPLPGILDREFIRGGLRSHGADIDWIRSNRPFELYPVEDRNAPPVIWVAQKNQTN
ncbi:MAG: hypothetical protein KDD66_08415 [Bdellovibrionales bacterium]|nr:hypothetical protein [Bdellovibrionales bacterium]